MLENPREREREREKREREREREYNRFIPFAISKWISFRQISVYKCKQKQFPKKSCRPSALTKQRHMFYRTTL